MEILQGTNQSETTRMQLQHPNLEFFSHWLNQRGFIAGISFLLIRCHSKKKILDHLLTAGVDFTTALLHGFRFPSSELRLLRL